MKTLATLGDMRGRVVAVTGGAGHIGRAIAGAMIEMGAAVALIDRDREGLALAAERLRGSGRPVTPITLDLELESERAVLPTRITENFGALDVLINNAAFVGDSQLGGWIGPLAEQRLDTWRRAVEVNLTASFHLTQVLLPLLQRSGRGAVVNISSIYGVLGPDMALYEGTTMGNPAAYAASKGGLVQLTRWLATTLAPAVRVNCISPGGMHRNQPDAFVRRYVERTPMKRMGTEEDLIGAVAFLASDLSGWVTGQNILVDGGWSAW